MPALLPDVRPLIISLLGRYVIQCQLDIASANLVQGLQGQRLLEQQNWTHLLEVLCSTVSPPTTLSHTTLQFTRYVSLLEQVQRLKEGNLTEQAVTEVVELLSNLCKAPELQDPSVAGKLTSLLVDTMSGLSRNAMEDYSKRVLDFVTEAMEWYTRLPNISLTGEAFEARKPVPLPSTISTPKSCGQKNSRRKRQRTTSSSPIIRQAAAPPKPKLRSLEHPKVLFPELKENGKPKHEDMEPLPEAKSLQVQLELNPPLPRDSTAQAPPPGAESSHPAVPPGTESSRPSVPPGNNPSVGTPSVGNPSMDDPSTGNPGVGIVTVDSSTPAGVIVTYPPILPPSPDTSKEHEDEAEEAKGTPTKGASTKGIFDCAESGTEMEWSSDESPCVNPLLDVSTLSPEALATPPIASIPRKGAWSSEESRCLLEGVEKYGEGKWKEIRAESYSVLMLRTTNQLKDKYRNIKGRPKHY